MIPSHHVRVEILKLLPEVTVALDVGQEVSHIETPGNLVDVNRLPVR